VGKKINILFCTAVIAFLAVIIFLIKDFNGKRNNDFRVYANSIANIVKRDNEKIRILSMLIIEKQKKIDDLKNTLTETRNDLENLDQKLAQPTPAMMPSVAPITASATKY